MICTANNDLILALLKRFDVFKGHFNATRHNRHLKDVRLPLRVNINVVCGHRPLFGDYFTVTGPNTVENVTGLLSRAHRKQRKNRIKIGNLKGFRAAAVVLVIDVYPELVAHISGIDVFGIDRVKIRGFGHTVGSREIVLLPNAGITRIRAYRSTRLIIARVKSNAGGIVERSVNAKLVALQVKTDKYHLVLTLYFQIVVTVIIAASILYKNFNKSCRNDHTTTVSACFVARALVIERITVGITGNINTTRFRPKSISYATARSGCKNFTRAKRLGNRCVTDLSAVFGIHTVGCTALCSNVDSNRQPTLRAKHTATVDGCDTVGLILTRNSNIVANSSNMTVNTNTVSGFTR